MLPAGSEFVPLAFNRVVKEGSFCSMTAGETGKCVLSSRCSLPNHEKLKRICEWKELSPVVCCPNKEQIKEFVPLAFNKVLEEGSECGGSSGAEGGECVSSLRCQLPNEEKLKRICKWNGATPIVCCPKNMQIEGKFSLPDCSASQGNELGSDVYICQDDVLYQQGGYLYNCSYSPTLRCDQPDYGFFGFPDCSVNKKEPFCRSGFSCEVNKLYHFGGNLYSCTVDSPGWKRQMCCVQNDHNPNQSRELALQSYQEVGSLCNVNDNVRGTCEWHYECNVYPTEDPTNVCGKGYPNRLMICCSEKEKIQCGKPYSTHVTFSNTLYGRAGEYKGIYVLNRTADVLQSQNYSLQITRVADDSIYELHARKGSKRFLYKKHLNLAVAPAGGVPAAVERAQYMASLGMKLAGGGIEWLCDGVVISSLWVMSAAHCFVGSNLTPDFIRLGVYEKEKSFYEPYPDYDGIEDFGISEVVYYPDFVNPQRYHDIVLIRLSRPIPNGNSKIERICLPWWPENRTTEGQHLTLSGWGATKFLGDKINVLHEVNLTVFHTAVCDASYSTLSDFDTKWPEGMDPERILCVGSAEGGKDACQGDSGGPLVYTDKRGLFTLAGIVSAGYGCGLQEFPGIYIPITAPEYLEWIKKIAY